MTRVVEFEPRICRKKEDGSQVEINLASIAEATGLDQRQVRDVLCQLDADGDSFHVNEFTIQWVPPGSKGPWTLVKSVAFSYDDVSEPDWDELRDQLLQAESWLRSGESDKLGGRATFACEAVGLCITMLDAIVNDNEDIPNDLIARHWLENVEWTASWLACMTDDQQLQKRLYAVCGDPSCRLPLAGDKEASGSIQMVNDADFRLQAVLEHLQRQSEKRWAEESQKRVQQGYPPLTRTTFRPQSALMMYLICPVCGEAQATLEEAEAIARCSRRPEDFVDLCTSRIDPHLEQHRREMGMSD